MKMGKPAIHIDMVVNAGKRYVLRGEDVCVVRSSMLTSPKLGLMWRTAKIRFNI